jgi:hypothetical protein
MNLRMTDSGTKPPFLAASLNGGSRQKPISAHLLALSGISKLQH